MSVLARVGEVKFTESFLRWC